MSETASEYRTGDPICNCHGTTVKASFCPVHSKEPRPGGCTQLQHCDHFVSHEGTKLIMRCCHCGRRTEVEATLKHVPREHGPFLPNYL